MCDIARSGRALLALALAGLAMLAAPGTAPAATTGSIAGTVTAAATHVPIAGVRVCATSENHLEEVVEFCAHSAADGSYSIGELPEARYAVEFLSAVEGLNYAYQAWNGKPDPFACEPGQSHDRRSSPGLTPRSTKAA